LVPPVKTPLFVAACTTLYAVGALVTPRAFPLVEPDSAGYIEFSNTRTAIYPAFLRIFGALGLGLEQITYVQLALFVLSLAALIAALLRAGMPRALTALMVVALLASFHLPSYHWTIMTESIFISVSTISVAFWLDYLRTSRIQFLASICLCVGLLIAIRPAGIAFLPMIPISIWLQWHRRDVSRTAVAAVVVVSLALGPVIERVIYRAVHGDQQASLIPGTLLGKAAMVVRQDTTFTGSHASNLRELGSALYTIYRPVREYLSHVPSLPALPIMTSAYEVAAQYQVLNEEIALMSARTGVPGDVLRTELGMQAIRDNIPGYIRLSLIHYIGQWSIMALKFPPTARSINDYVAGYPRVPLADKLDDLYLHPPASRIAVVVYPALLFAGVLTLAVGLLLPIFVVRRFVGDGPLRYVMIAAFFAATAHVYTLLISFMNASTPRYLIAVYPQILLVGLFLLLAAMRRSRVDRPDRRGMQREVDVSAPPQHSGTPQPQHGTARTPP
jgi:hypothetical protein